MGYVLPNEKDLPNPTFKQFSENPGYYWRKLEEYSTTPYIYHHLGLAGIRKRIVRLIAKHSH